MFPQMICSTRDENAKAAMENYIRILQQAFDHYQNLWEDYVTLQEKYEQRNVQSPVKAQAADERCVKTKELTPQRDVNVRTVTQESDSKSLLELETLNMSYSNFNSDTWSSSADPDDDNNLPESPVFSRSRLYRDIGKAVKKSLKFSNAANSNKVTSDMTMHHNSETVFSKCDKNSTISTTHHVETTFLPDGKKLKQSRLAFCPIKCDKQKTKTSSNVTVVDTSSRSKNSAEKWLSTAKPSVESNVRSANETLEDVIEISPTQRVVKSKIKHCLTLKRKSTAKQTKKDSPDESKSRTVAPMITIEDVDFQSPFEHISADDGPVTAVSTTINTGNSSPAKVFNKTDVQIAKFVEAERKKQPMTSKTENVLNVNDPVYEDETFYLPAEQAAKDRSDAINDFTLTDTENQPPAKKMLVDKYNTLHKDVPKQFNTWCRTDRAKLNGWDCWECKRYYENLSLSEKELQKRKNQCSRHRNKYERPRTPEGFWDVDFPETLSSTSSR